jgi:light-regulated signal transduction histidine kinase (bacteriophytochrome)
MRKQVELERSNRELQDFASVASHDLQEPLRKVRAFGDRLSAKYGAELTDQGRDYLERMQDAAARMQTLINDLLTFSRVTTRAHPFVPVDLNTLVSQVLADLEVRIQQSKATVEVDELPTIDGDQLQLRQLFQNLVSNALKFQPPDVAPVVRVYAEDVDDGSVRLCVQDNGIGFDEKYLDRIFTIFQRLHGRVEYEGTGIGLAVCRKIVDRHGGSISARSAPGQGATFLVTLPRSQPESLDVPPPLRARELEEVA